MADEILSNSSYILQFSVKELQQHNELLLVGATFSELFQKASASGDIFSPRHSMVEALEHFLFWVAQGERLSRRWQELAWSLERAYNCPLMPQ